MELFWLIGMGCASRVGFRKGMKLPGLETLVEEALLSGDSLEALMEVSDMSQ